MVGDLGIPTLSQKTRKEWATSVVVSQSVGQPAIVELIDTNVSDAHVSKNRETWGTHVI